MKLPWRSCWTAGRPTTWSAFQGGTRSSPTIWFRCSTRKGGSARRPVGKTWRSTAGLPPRLPRKTLVCYTRRRPHQAGCEMNPVSVIIVDDHPLFREGVRNILAAEADIDVIAESTSGDQAIELIRDKQPMVALIDVNLPSLNGIQVTRQLVSD